MEYASILPWLTLHSSVHDLGVPGNLQTCLSTTLLVRMAVYGARAMPQRKQRLAIKIKMGFTMLALAKA